MTDILDEIERGLIPLRARSVVATRLGEIGTEIEALVVTPMFGRLRRIAYTTRGVAWELDYDGLTYELVLVRKPMEKDDG